MKCKICGKEFARSESGYGHMSICSTECLREDFWNRNLDEKAIIINGVCYHDGGNKPEGSSGGYLGHGGRVFRIRMNDGREFSTNNLWYNGEAPKERKIKDNAVFVRTGSKVSNY